jgi:hypothetical protein
MSKEKSVEPVSKPKRITLQYLLKHDLPIWVINRGSKGESGQIVLQLGNRDNWKGITIPPGSDPVCVSNLAPTEMLRMCFGLNRAIDSGALELLDPDKAEEYYTLNEDRKQVMQEKLAKYMYKQQENVPEPKQIRFGDDSSDSSNFRNFREDGLPADLTKTRAKFVQSGPKAKIGDLCQRASFDAIDEKLMLESLLEISSSLTPVDLDYVEKNGKFDSVRRWAHDQLKEKK